MDREQRLQLIETLRGLSDQDDAAALASAREAAALLEAAGLDWADVIAPGAGQADLASDFDHGTIDFEGDEESGNGATADDARLGALLKHLETHSGFSVETRAELNDFARDLAEGTLDPADRKYIVALANRLGVHG